MDPSARVAAGLADLAGRTCTMQQAIVTGTSPLTIDGLDGDVELAALGWYRPALNDSVVVARYGSTALVLGSTTASWAPAPVGTVAAYTAGSATVTISTVDGTFVLQKLKAWSPVVGEACFVAWTLGSSGWVGVGVGALGATPTASAASAPPAPPPPPAPKPATPTAATTGTTTVLATASGTWRGGSWRTDTSKVIQGVYGGRTNSGYLFYGSRLTAHRGKTVTSARIWLHAAGGGAAAATPVRLYRHTATSKTAAQPTTAGSQQAAPALADFASGWFDIPVAFAQALIDSGGGVALIGSEYTTLLGITGTPRDLQQGAIQFTWRK